MSATFLSKTWVAPNGRCQGEWHRTRSSKVGGTKLCGSNQGGWHRFCSNTVGGT
jgi:hypothetical protein